LIVRAGVLVQLAFKINFLMLLFFFEWLAYPICIMKRTSKNRLSEKARWAVNISLRTFYEKLP